MDWVSTKSDTMLLFQNTVQSFIIVTLKIKDIRILVQSGILSEKTLDR